MVLSLRALPPLYASSPSLLRALKASAEQGAIES